MFHQNPNMVTVDAAIQQEHDSQRRHLEKSVSGLMKRMSADSAHSKDDNVRIMQVTMTTSVSLNSMHPTSSLWAYYSVYIYSECTRFNSGRSSITYSRFCDRIAFTATLDGRMNLARTVHCLLAELTSRLADAVYHNV